MTDYTLPEEDEGSSFDVGRIVSAARRRFLFFLIPFILILIGSVAVILILPQKYQSVGTILVETQQIPTELVQSSVTTDPNQRITIIQQRVMTRRNLLQIIDKYDVFGEDRKLLPVSELIQRMQRQISINVITSDVSGSSSRRGTTTIAFSLGFEHENPQIASQVANELVTLFLSENVRTRTARASETTAFLNNETEKMQEQLTEIEGKIAAYKQEHGDALPEHLDLRLKMLERAELEERDLNRDIRSLEEEKRYLQIELTSARSGRNVAGSTVQKTELEQNIESLKKALLNASTRLTDSHPDIISLKKRIAALEEQQAQEDAAALAASGKSSTDPAYNPLIEKLQLQIRGTDEKMAEARKQIIAAKKKQEELEAIIIEIPQVERGLSVLNRNYREALEKFNNMEAKQAQAQLSQNLEEGKKAERFVLLEPPVVPTEPISPNRTKILGLGGAAGLAFGVGCIFLIELLDRRIRSASELEAVLKHPPIVSIPYIHTLAEAGKHRHKVYLYIAIPIVVIIMMLAAVHFLYQPLDTLFYRGWVAINKLIVTLF